MTDALRIIANQSALQLGMKSQATRELKYFYSELVLTFFGFQNSSDSVGGCSVVIVIGLHLIGIFNFMSRTSREVLAVMLMQGFSKNSALSNCFKLVSNFLSACSIRLSLNSISWSFGVCLNKLSSSDTSLLWLSTKMLSFGNCSKSSAVIDVRAP